MKKFLALMICTVLLIGMWCIAINGAEKPAGAGILPTELVYHTALPDAEQGITMISQGLSAPDVYSQKHFTSESLSDLEKWELSRHLTYGISIMGVSGIARKLSAAIDGVWQAGNTLIPGNPMLSNGNFAHGAFGYFPAEQAINVKGETGKDDSIYGMVLTFNFKEVAAIDSFGYISPTNNIPQAADIYVSNDGENWTLVGYYDLTTKRMLGNDAFSAYCPSLWSDVLGKDISTGTDRFQLNLWNLGGVEAQFLRVAHSAQGGAPIESYLNATTGYFSTEYSDWSKGYGLETNFREAVVFGKLTGKTNNITATEPAAPQTTPAPEEDEGEETTTSTPVALPPAKATTAKATTASPDAGTDAATTAAEEKKGGCGSTILSSAAVLGVIGLGITTVSARRRRK